MSLTDRFIEIYVGNAQYVEVMKAILGLNQYEATSFIALALLGECSATRVADTAGIPRSKIYSSLKSLKKKGLILETHDIYKVDFSQVERLPHRVKDLFGSFQKFVEKLAIYSRTSGAKVQAIKSILKEAISKSGYHTIPLDREMLELDERMEIHFDRFFMEFRPPHTDFRKLREVYEARTYLIDELVESSTSGIKVAISIITEEKLHIGGDITALGTLAICSALRCEAVIAVVLPQVRFLERAETQRLPKAPRLYVMLAHEPTFEKNVFRILTDLDRSWLDSKREVDKIGNEIMELKMQLTSTLDSTYQHARDVSNKGGKHKERYLEILERIQADLIASDDSLSTIRKEFEKILERLELHRAIPDPAEIAEIDKRVGVLRGDLQRKIQARDQLLEDILAHMRGGKAYVEYGYVTNPFVFTVPPEYPRDIVDQCESKERFKEFLEEMMAGSSRNFVFVCAEEGMGKTHFLNFYAKSINSKEFGNAIALRLNCKPRSDMIDLYTQISLYISRLVDSKILKQEILKILEVSGTPKSITDLTSLLRSLNSNIMDSGFQGMFLMIDDFENTLPLELTAITPRSILQLTELIRLENMGIVLAMRERSWETWNKEIRRRIPRVGRYGLIKLGKFGPNETSELLRYRVEEKDEQSTKEPPQFDQTVSARICESGQGVPRQIITIAREVFRIAILEKRKITVELVDSVTSQDSLKKKK